MTYNSPQSGGWSVPDSGSSGGPYQQNPGGYQEPTSGYPASGAGGYQDPNAGYQQQDPYQTSGAPASGYPAQSGFNDPYQQQNAGYAGGYQDPNAGYQQQDPYGGGFAPPQKSGPSTGLIVGIIAAVAVLIGLGIGGFFLLGGDDDSGGDDKSSSKTDDPKKTDDPDPDPTNEPGPSTDAPYTYDVPRGYDEVDVPAAMDIPGLESIAINDSSSSSDAILIGHMSSYGQPETALESFIGGTGLGEENFEPLPDIDGAEGSVYDDPSNGMIYVFANDDYVVLIVTQNTSSDAKDAIETILDSFKFE
ncbi:MAG: hypothetical protein HOQ05_00900 [Corynebacteriales bacterium]|nr:hypothetical protein [Mycobacteriales bacterium]